MISKGKENETNKSIISVVLPRHAIATIFLPTLRRVVEVDRLAR